MEFATCCTLNDFVVVVGTVGTKAFVVSNTNPIITKIANNTAKFFREFIVSCLLLMIGLREKISFKNFKTGKVRGCGLMVTYV